MEELDQTTIERAKRGDGKAFRRVYDHYGPFVWRVVFRTVNGDTESASQVMQDTFIKAHRSLKSYKHQSSLSTWLYRIAYNAAMSHLKSRAIHNRRSAPLTEAMPARDVRDRTESRDMVERVLAGLDVQDRFLLITREVQGVPFEELAQILKETPGALRTRVHRIKESIRKEFCDEQG